MKVFALTAVGIIFLSACNSVEKPIFTETTVTYHGRPLDCITWDGSHDEVGLDCDFVKYHKEEVLGR